MFNELGLAASGSVGQRRTPCVLAASCPAGVVPAWLSNPQLLEQVARDCLLQTERVRRCGASFALFSQRRVRITTLITRWVGGNIGCQAM